MELCKGLFAHTIGSLTTVKLTRNSIYKKCDKCGYTETLPRSQKNIYFFSDKVQQTKRWAADEDIKALLQPLNQDGSTNEEFTEAYGFNPMDERTKVATPKLQGGLA